MNRINSAYLAYPIDQAMDFAHDFYAMIEEFKAQLVMNVSWVFDPGDAFRVNPERGVDPGLATINRAALNNADAVVAFLPKGVASVGVPMEIDRARAQGKVVLVFTDVDSYMLAMHGVALVKGFSEEALVEGFNWLITQEVYDPDDPGFFGETLWTGDPDCAPMRTYTDDAGYDLIVSERTVIPSLQFRDVPCGISVQLPDRVWAMITGRSSTLRKRGLLVSTGIIDTGYRGPLFAGVQNLDPSSEAWVEPGERIAQLILFSNTSMRYPMMRVDALGPSERGVNGFGSTGV